MDNRVDVSLVVVAYNMSRELPRTLQSVSPLRQRGVNDMVYEVIVVDNGSAVPVTPPADGSWTLLRVANPSVSPAFAANLGIGHSRGKIVGVMIDGARLVSPGLIYHARLAARLDERPVIATVGLHLGPDIQARSIQNGYDQEQEDELLRQVSWPTDGYRLFDISAFAASSRAGWFGPLSESNALFLTRSMWEELGGYDERFRCRGGGLVNLDTYVRACGLHGSQAFVLLGEGTFHQIHGGVSTNASVSPWPEFHAEYQAIRGYPFQPPSVDPIYVGQVRPQVLPLLGRSIQEAMAP